MSSAPVVLLVEDDTDTREMYADSLTFSGFRVHTATDADEALSLALTHDPQIVVTDFVLPGGHSGADLCSWLKQDGRTAHIPTLLMTASSHRNAVEAALTKGCAVVRLKPYLPDALERDVRTLIAGQSVKPWPREHTPQGGV